MITQSDLFRGEVERLGSWNEVLKSHLGNLYGAYVHSGRIPVFPVSAVSETTVRDDGGGRMVRVPKAGFKSEGLEDLINWLRASTQVVAKKKRKRVGVPPDQTASVPSEHYPAPPVAPGKRRILSTLSPVVAAVICILVLQNTCTILVKQEDTRSRLEKILYGALPPIPKIDLIPVIIVTLIVCVIVFAIARSIEDDMK